MKKVIHWILMIAIFLHVGMPPAQAELILSLENELPAPVLKTIIEAYPGHILESYQRVDGIPEGDHLFVLIKSDSERRLLCFQQEDNRWDSLLDVKEAVPQTDLPAYLSYRPQGKNYRMDVGCEKFNSSYTSNGMNLLILVVNGETYEETAFYQWRDGNYQITEYSKRTQCFVNIVGEEWVFSNLGSGFDGYVKYPLDTDIRSVNFDRLPATLHELPTLHEGIPVIACAENGFPHTALCLQDVTFPAEKKYEVYMGPGKRFGRSANGKASVSTNDWIQVFGEYDGWLLIQYGVSNEKFRIGWITKAALPKGITVPALDFAAGNKNWLEGPGGSYRLTDDPFGTQAPIVTITGSPEVEMLARLGLDWVYIRVEYDGMTYYGFVPAELTLGNG